MQMSAHPLVVAVALGVLPSHALDEADDAEVAASRQVRPCDELPCTGAERARWQEHRAVQGLVDDLQRDASAPA